MLLILSEAAERRIADLASDSSRDPSSPITGLNAQIIEREQVLRIGASEEPFPPPMTDAKAIACFVSHDDNSVALSVRSPAIALRPTAANPLTALYQSSPGTEPVECKIEVIRVETDVFSRLKGIFDTDVLRPKTVAVFGLGSGGGVVAMELAKCGVGSFILADFDRLKTHNVARHVCGLDDVGRFKTSAVRDAIRRRNPNAAVACYETDVTEDADALSETIAASDVVIVATDTEVSRYMINEACLELDRIAVYGGAYERAFAGEIVRVVPGVGGCYACVRQRTAAMIRSISPQQSFDYTDDEDFHAEPGLGLDVGFIALLQAKIALMTLLRGVDSSVDDIDAQMVIWTNSARPEDGKIFSEPMARYFIDVPKSPDCPACGEIAGPEPT